MDEYRRVCDHTSCGATALRYNMPSHKLIPEDDNVCGLDLCDKHAAALLMKLSQKHDLFRIGEDVLRERCAAIGVKYCCTSREQP